MTRQPVALHVVASINRDIGGPAVTVTRLAAALCEQEVDTALATLDYERHGAQADAGRARLASMRAGVLATRLRGFSPAFARAIEQQAKGADIVHNHGLWMFPNLYAARAAQAVGAPLVVSPRGMLDAWAMGRSRARKWLAWKLWQRDVLARAALLHATSQHEAAGIRSLGFMQPIAMIPNGVDVPDDPHAVARDRLEERFPALRGKRWLLFLSRLHPKKGIAELLDAWARASRRGETRGWELVVAGPDLDGFRGTVDAAIVSEGIASSVTCTGMLSGDDKACALGNSAALVLPTRSENFGLVVAEALAHRLPVITTHAAPWACLETEGCGWWIPLEPSALDAALSTVMRAPEQQLHAMGHRGRELVQRRFGWSHAAAQMKAAYAWLLRGGDPPPCVASA